MIRIDSWKRRTPCLVLGCFLVYPAVQASAEPTELASISRTSVESGSTMGVSVAVLRGGTVVHASAHGMANVELDIAMSRDTPLRAASVSKTVTAAIALRLAAQHQLDLDDPLTKWIPELEDVVPQGVSFRRALSHTSGLTDFLEVAYARPELETSPLTVDFVIDAVRRLGSDFEPGESWGYSNTGFYLAALAMSRATERPWFELVRTLIAEPLGLRSLTSCDELIEEDDLRGYRRHEDTATVDPLYLEQGVFGDGGLCATATDLALLFRGLDRGEFTSPSQTNQLLSPTALDDGTIVDYGLGTRLGELEGLRLWGHTGSIGAYVATVFRFPGEDVTVSVLQNTTDAAEGALVLAWRLSEVALGLWPAALRENDLDHAHPVVSGEFIGFGESSSPDLTRLSIVEGKLRIESVDDPKWSRIFPALGPGVFVPRNWPRDRIRLHVQDGRATGYSEYYAGMFARYSGRFRD